MPPLNDNLKPSTEDKPMPIINEESLQLKLQRELHTMFTGEGSADNFHAYLTKKKERPAHWKHRANVPYYRERFALEFKVVLDAMVKDGQDREYRYQDFPDAKKNTIYLRVNQSKLYLLEELDFDGRYTKLCQCLTITRERSGVRISFNKDVREGTGFMPASIVNRLTVNELQIRIDSFIENAKLNDKFEEKNLCLRDEDVQALRDSFVGIENFAANVTTSTIKIYKIA